MTSVWKVLVLKSPEIEKNGVDSPTKIGHFLHFGVIQAQQALDNLKLSLCYHLILKPSPIPHSAAPQILLAVPQIPPVALAAQPPAKQSLTITVVNNMHAHGTAHACKH